MAIKQRHSRLKQIFPSFFLPQQPKKALQNLYFLLQKRVKSTSTIFFFTCAIFFFTCDFKIFTCAFFRLHFCAFFLQKSEISTLLYHNRPYFKLFFAYYGVKNSRNKEEFLTYLLTPINK